MFQNSSLIKNKISQGMPQNSWLATEPLTKPVCVEVLWPSQPNGVMSSVVSLTNHTFIGQA